MSMGTPFFISKLKFSYDKYSVDIKYGQKSIVSFISEELP